MFENNRTALALILSLATVSLCGCPGGDPDPAGTNVTKPAPREPAEAALPMVVPAEEPQEAEVVTVAPVEPSADPSEDR